MLPRQFLVQMAHEAQLTLEQEEVFLLRFAEQKDYQQIGRQLNTSPGACLKRMGQVYKKFGIEGGSRGKETLLRHLLFKRIEQDQNARFQYSETEITNEPEQKTYFEPGATSSLPIAASESLNVRTYLEYPDGPVNLASPFYVKRPPIEERCYQEIIRPGALIRIKAPRYMGKTSLLLRILHEAKKQGYQSIDLSFQLAEQEVLTSLERFLKWFCVNLEYGLQLPNRLDEFWINALGSMVNCKNYLEQYLLKEIDKPLVLGLYELDRIFGYPQSYEDFFRLLRYMHEQGKRSAIWQKLRLVLVHSTEFYLPVDINQSPFNVGLPITLPEFSREQVEDLVGRHGLNWNASQIDKLINLVGGHPFLIRLALYHIACRDITFAELFQNITFTQAGIYGNHLRIQLLNLQNIPGLAAAMKEVVNAKQPISLPSEQAYKLQSMGLVHLIGNYVEPKCELYREYFGKEFNLGDDRSGVSNKTE